MFRIDLPFTDAYFLLTPRLGFFSRHVQLAILAGLLGLVVFLVIRLYRSELRIVPRRFALLLLGLRLSLVVTLFLVSSLKPSFAHTVSETVPSKVLVALDRSDSMEINDSQRSVAEKLELAKGLGLVRDLADDKTLDGWIKEAKEGRSLAGSTRFTQVTARIDGLTRRQIASQVLAPEGANLLQAIGEKHQLDVANFTQTTAEIPKTWEAVKRSLATDPASPGSNFTDIKQPMIRALERDGTGESKLLGVVVLTDGQHNWGVGPTTKSKELGQRGVPVYFVGIGAKDPPPDVAILSVKATPPTVFKNAYTTVEARVLVNNLPPGKIRVTLAYPDVPGVKKREPLVEIIDHEGESGPRLVTFTARMDQPGTETLTVTAEHRPFLEGDPRKDTRPENNTRPVVVTVSPDKAKVLLVDGEVRWEFHYLQTALIRDETMDTTSVVFDQPRLNLVDAEGTRKMGLPDLALPKDPEALLNFDCVILGDITPEQLPKAERERLEHYVSERGGTLVLLAGKKSMPLEFVRDGDPFQKLLPIRNPKVYKADQGFKVALTGEGSQTGFLRLDPNPGVSAETWNNLPPHYWAVTGQAKEGAVTLASVAPSQPFADANATREWEQNNGLVVRQNYGFGKVVYVGIDSTWRWRFKKGDTYNHRFWSQVIRWAASDRALIAGNEFVRFGAREPVYRADQEVELIVRLSDKVKNFKKDAMAGARLLHKPKGGPETAVGMMPLRPHPVIPREYIGSQGNLPPGDYDIELVIPDIEDKLNGPDGKKLRAHVQVLPADTGEMIDLATNWGLMEDLAARTGGKVFPADRAKELVELLQSRSATREYTVEQKIWQSWWTLALLIGLLTAEWLARKWAGLP
ncbi:vWA domain-containing protein [Zavarzinella formosa]|uniref:VWA domain-containing protein n=1 Tax=Zavarzinella formosa TaxID=360055 RepID=UPI0002DDF962|nr:VWA domain-containing protein [Zavarzinella formosa]